MRVLNFYGVSSCLVPVINSSLPFVEVGGTYANNTITFFDGLPPSTSELYEINNYAELIATYGDKKVMEISPITLTYEQDNTKLRRVIKKAPDVLETTFLQDVVDGIGWFALTMYEPSTTSGKSAILFSDSIGLKEEEMLFVTIDSKTGTSGSSNWLRDISMILTEVSGIEV
jgi:hypothetical protein